VERDQRTVGDTPMGRQPVGSPSAVARRSKRREKTTSNGDGGARWVRSSASGPPPNPARTGAPVRTRSQAARADRTGVTATSKRPGPRAPSAADTEARADIGPVERTLSTAGAWRSTSAPWSWVSATSSASG